MRNEPKRALASLERARVSDPQNPDVLNSLGAARVSLGDLDGAETAYRQALALGDFGEIWFNLGVVAERRGAGNGAAAAECYRRAIAINPADGRPRANLAALDVTAAEMAHLRRCASRAPAAYSIRLGIRLSGALHLDPFDQPPRDHHTAKRGLTVQALRDGLDEGGGVDPGVARGIHRAVNDPRQVASHRAAGDRADHRGLDPPGERADRRGPVQFAALSQRAGPREDGRHGVRARLLAREVLLVVPRHGAVRRFVLEVAVRGDEHGGHHAELAEAGGHHVALHVAVVVYSPELAALVRDDLRDRVVD